MVLEENLNFILSTLKMEIHQDFAKWAVARGVKINGIAANRFPGRGLGIIAEKNFRASTIFLILFMLALGFVFQLRYHRLWGK